MISRASLRDFGDKAVWVGILLITASLPLSKFGMSVGQFIIAGGWLLGGSIGAKFSKAFRQPVVWILWGIYFLHLLGLWNTSNFEYAWSDLRIKIPLFLMPLFFSSIQPLTGKQYRTVLKVLVAATIASTLVSLAIFLGIIHREIHNIRDISIFISHIRLALLICISITCCIWFYRINETKRYRLLLLVCVTWLIGFLILIESLTGIIILCSGLTAWIFIRIFRQGIPVYQRVVFSIMILTISVGSATLFRYIFIDSVKEIKVDVNKLPKKTALGGVYIHDVSRQDTENGRLVFINICERELDSVWNTRSNEVIYGPNKQGSMLRITLLRYLTSKGLTKDAEGVNKLDTNEVKLIESGVASINDIHLSDLKGRIKRLAWEYRQYYFLGDPSGHSVTQRLEFWKAAKYIILQQPWLGVGTGDLKYAFSNAYQEMNSKLEATYRLRSHNQYLSIAVAFGIPGLLYFLFALVAPWFMMQKRKDFIYSGFLFIALCSMLSEDTLETQAGVTFFAFLNAFLLFNDSRRKKTEISELHDNR